MANCITGLRILCGIALLFCPALSPAFFALYLAAGITDMLDGAVARKTHTVSEFGSRLDTIADFVLVVVCLVKLTPVMDMPAWVYAWIGVVALIKGINVVSGYVAQKRFVALHTAANRIAGALLFLLPFTLTRVDLRYSAGIVCAVSTFAAIQEGHFIRTGRDPEREARESGR